MAKKKFRPPPPYGPKPYDPNAGTQVGEREYNPNSVTRYNADQFLKNQATAGSVITPGFKEMSDFMNWLQQFVNVNRDEYNTNPFSELKPNPLMAQLRAGINPYPGTRGYIPPTAPGIGGSSGGSSGGIAGGNNGRKGGPMPPIGIPPSERPGGVFGPQPPINPPQSSPKPPIYKSPPTGRFAPQPAPLPPVSMPDKMPPRVGGLPAGPDKLPPYVKKELNKKPTLDSFIPRYIRNAKIA